MSPGAVIFNNLDSARASAISPMLPPAVGVGSSSENINSNAAQHITPSGGCGSIPAHTDCGNDRLDAEHEFPRNLETFNVPDQGVYPRYVALMSTAEGASPDQAEDEALTAPSNAQYAISDAALSQIRSRLSGPAAPCSSVSSNNSGNSATSMPLARWFDSPLGLENVFMLQQPQDDGKAPAEPPPAHVGQHHYHVQMLQQQLQASSPLGQWQAVLSPALATVNEDVDNAASQKATALRNGGLPEPAGGGPQWNNSPHRQHPTAGKASQGSPAPASAAHNSHGHPYSRHSSATKGVAGQKSAPRSGSNKRPQQPAVQWRPAGKAKPAALPAIKSASAGMNR